MTAIKLEFDFDHWTRKVPSRIAYQERYLLAVMVRAAKKELRLNRGLKQALKAAQASNKLLRKQLTEANEPEDVTKRELMAAMYWWAAHRR